MRKIHIHFFGEKAAFNLNNKLYCWNQSAKSIMVYYQVDKAAESTPATTGTTFSGGTVAISAVAGLVLGAAVTALCIKAASKRKEKATA